MTSAPRFAVGWCHQCGTLQLKDDMPTEWIKWAEAVEPVCVNDPDEPWGLGVWDKGQHLAQCPIVEFARARSVDWQPTLSECTCGTTHGGNDLRDEAHR